MEKPIRCFTCGKPFGISKTKVQTKVQTKVKNKSSPKKEIETLWDKLKKCKDAEEMNKILNKYGFIQLCCRTNILGSYNINDITTMQNTAQEFMKKLK